MHRRTNPGRGAAARAWSLNLLQLEQATSLRKDLCYTNLFSRITPSQRLHTLIQLPPPSIGNLRSDPTGCGSWKCASARRAAAAASGPWLRYEVRERLCFDPEGKEVQHLLRSLPEHGNGTAAADEDWYDLSAVYKYTLE